jgi:Carboxypeptidase regulatory-like domain
MSNFAAFLVFLLLHGVILAQGAIEGRVINQVTHQGIAGADVKVYRGRDLRYQSTTAPDGSFQMLGVAKDHYSVTASAEGFAVPMFANTPVPIAVSDSGTVRTSLELAPLVKLRGRLLDPDGKPAADARVELYCFPVLHVDISKRDGKFEFQPLPPGKCKLSARPATKAAHEPKDRERVEPVTTFYPASIEPWGDDVILTGITPEQEVELQLQTAPVHRVSGVVLDDSNRPIKGMRVELTHSVVDSLPDVLTQSLRAAMPSAPPPRPMKSLRTEDTLVTQDDGRFEFPSVPQGDWTLRASSKPEGQLAADGDQLGESEISVSRFDVEHAEVRVASSFSLFATVDWPKDVPAPQKPLAVAFLQPVKHGRLVSGSSEADGRVYFDQIYPGSFIFQAQILSPQDVYIAAVIVGGRDVAGQPVLLTASSGPIRVVVKTGSGSVHGTIEKGSAAFVVLARAPLTSEESVRVIRSGADGFSFPRLAPGEYLVAAFDQDPSEGLADPARRAALVPLAKSITVEERGRTEVELPLRAWQ